MSQFFLIFLITIIVTRLFLWLTPIKGPTINGFRIHHFLYGIILMTLYVLTENIILFAIGLGLFIDEAPLFLSQKWDTKGYNSSFCYFGVVVSIITVYLIDTLSSNI